MQMTIDMTEKAEIWYGIKIQKKWRTGSLHYRGIQFSREQLNKSARQYRIKNKKSRADWVYYEGLEKVGTVGWHQIWLEESWGQKSNEELSGNWKVKLHISRLVL